MRVAKSFTLSLLFIFTISQVGWASTETPESEKKISNEVEKSTHEQLSVSFSQDELLVCHCSTGKAVIRVYDLTGTLILSETTINEESNINLQMLEAGKYYFSATDESGNYCGDSFKIDSAITYASN